jgi:hypothetical protein
MSFEHSLSSLICIRSFPNPDIKYHLNYDIQHLQSYPDNPISQYHRCIINRLNLRYTITTTTTTLQLLSSSTQHGLRTMLGDAFSTAFLESSLAQQSNCARRHITNHTAAIQRLRFYYQKSIRNSLSYGLHLPGAPFETTWLEPRAPSAVFPLLNGWEQRRLDCVGSVRLEASVYMLSLLCFHCVTVIVFLHLKGVVTFCPRE